MTRFAAEPRMHTLAALALFSCFLATYGCDTTAHTPTPTKGDRSRRTNPILETDADVDKYLAEKGKDVAILRCKSPVNIQWMTAVVPYVDLECEVLGSVRSIQWFHGHRAIDTEPGRRHSSTVRPHVKHGKYFGRWLDYTLRIHRATEDDSGEYTLRVGGAGEFGSEGEREERHRIRLLVTTDFRPKEVREPKDEKQSTSQTRARQRKKKSQRGKQRRSAAEPLAWA